MTAEDIKLYSLIEVAKILRVTRQTVYNQVHAGRLKAVKVGKEYRVTDEDLQAYIRTGSSRNK